METNEKNNSISTLAASTFKSAFDVVQAAALRTAQAKGWLLPTQEVNHAEQLALMHAELSEGLEYLRESGMGKMSTKIPEFKGIEEELADVVIRIMSYAQREELNVSDAILKKMAFNTTRDYRHGGKQF